MGVFTATRGWVYFQPLIREKRTNEWGTLGMAGEPDGFLIVDEWATRPGDYLIEGHPPYW